MIDINVHTLDDNKKGDINIYIYIRWIHYKAKTILYNFYFFNRILKIE